MACRPPCLPSLEFVLDFDTLVNEVTNHSLSIRVELSPPARTNTCQADPDRHELELRPKPFVI